MFGPLLLFKERSLFTGKGLFLMLLGNVMELIVYSSCILVFIFLFLKSEFGYLLCIGIFASSTILWILLMKSTAEPNGEVKSKYYKSGVNTCL